MTRELAELAGAIEERLDRRWRKSETWRTEDKARLGEANALLARVLPAGYTGPRASLVLRAAPALVRAVDAWRWDDDLLLLGPAGVGKSSAAALLVLRLVRYGEKHAGGDWERAKNIVWLAAEDLGGPLDAACAARLLVLDGIETGVDSARLAWLLERRVGRPTVGTSRLTRDELRALGGARLTTSTVVRVAR